MVSDETMAAWVKEQNRGAPAWEDLDASARAWWRDRYVIRHAGQTQGRADLELQATAEALILGALIQRAGVRADVDDCREAATHVATRLIRAGLVVK